MAEEQERIAGSFATVTPIHKSKNQALSAVDYRAGSTAGQVEEEEQVPTVQQYDQTIATQPYTSSNVDDGYIADTSPYYGGGYDQTVPYPPDCLYSPYDDSGLYGPTTEIIVFSNTTRTFMRRPRPAGRFAAPRMMPPRMMPPRTIAVQRRPAGGQVRAPGGAVGSHRPVNTRSFRPSPGLRSR